ncbi:MAG: hypothetical protein H6Q29_443, partial [Bacteroidetes bacterium]|nr:hypothetical protein [Bacteroidota bacterium]
MNWTTRTALILAALMTHTVAAAQADGAAPPVGAAGDSSGGDGWGTYRPNAGFKLVKTDMGEVNLRIYTYIRYLNQKGLDGSYTDHFGATVSLDRRQDIQLNKVNIQFPGWLLDPAFRYILYVWTNNTAQGQGAQVVVAGNLTYTFSKHFTLGGGVNSLPGARSTEGSFPFWLTVDNRYIADEFFRPSYTMGLWARGTIVDGLTYNAMLGNNLSQLGVDAGQLDEHLNTVSGSLVWFPTTGEYGLNSNFGDFEHHQDAATRLGAHYTRSPEDRQGVPTTEAFENVTIRLSDGTVVFAPDAFGQGIQLDKATYNMTSVDAGVKYQGFSLEGEYYWRWVNNFTGRGVESLAFDQLTDNGFQLQASGMVVPGTLQVYSGYSKIFGDYGNPWDLRFGVNYHPWKNHVVRCNLE